VVLEYKYITTYNNSSMCPTAKELDVMAGNEVRLNTFFHPEDANLREVFRVETAPRPGSDGTLKLVSLLNGREVYISADENYISEKVY